MAKVTIKSTPGNLTAPKVTANIPKIAKTPAVKASKATQAGSLSPLFGQKRMRPTIQSVPTRTPSF